ncbi:MAG TPA: YitT family protein [Bacillota bacterium]|nr:YitT family protein [Bacillota bacterium]
MKKLKIKGRFKIDWVWIRNEVRDYLGILLGVTITALALVWLQIPNKIAAGGVSGVSIILYYLWRLPVALTMLGLNLPLFIACLWTFGARFGVKTLFGAGMISIMIEFWTTVVKLDKPLTSDPLLAALYGGVIAGVGMGLAFRFGGNTGGTDLAARLLNRFTGIPVGQALLIFDGTVVLTAGIVFRSVELAMYAIITIFVTSQVLDIVLEGLGYARAAFVISDHSEEIGQKILTDLQRGATGLFGRGLFSTAKKEVILCVIGRSEVIKLKELVREIDPRAFIIITEVHEVLGEGFKE